jgi:hypothetical protein
MCADLIGLTPRCRELKISPADAFVVAQGTRPCAIPHTHCVLNQQTRHSWVRNHSKQNSVEQTRIPKHQEANLDIVILFRSPIHSGVNSALENIPETMRGERSPADRNESRLKSQGIIGLRLKLPLAPSQTNSRDPPHAKT